MATTGKVAFGSAAVEWLMGSRDGRVLVIGGAGVARAVHRTGHQVVSLEQRQRRHPSTPGIVHVVGAAESLPFAAGCFDAVLVHQLFDQFAPERTLTEFARVLRPGGTVGLSWLTRDDSVPWVRRLVTLLRSVDASAMPGEFGTSAAHALFDAACFTDVGAQHYRQWVPIQRHALLDQVRALDAVGRLPERERAALLAEVSAVYDSASPGSEALRLPYQLRCWRARVDHTELTTPISVHDDGLVILL